MERNTTAGKRSKPVPSFHKRPKVPPPDSPVWPEEYRGDRWKPVYAFLFAGKCQLCAYSFAKSKWRRDMDKCDGISRMILCTNHPRSPGELREMLPTETCRNFKPKRWWTARRKAKGTPGLPPPLGEQSDPTIRHIPVGNDGLFATVDAADYPKLSKYKWFPMHRGRLTYAFCHTAGKVVSMHRMLMRPRANKVVDHIDGNGLNNRRCNLRKCTQRQNLANTRPPSDARRYGDSPHYIGVRRCRNKWQASITHRGRFYHLGLFDTPVEAAKARDAKAYEFWGPYAYLNFPEDYPRPEGKGQKSATKRLKPRNTRKRRHQNRK